MQGLTPPRTESLSPPLSLSQPSSGDSVISSGSDGSVSVVLGQGGCGRVSIVFNKDQRQLMVEKEPHDNHLRPRCLQILQHEVQVLKELHHPNIISVIHASSECGRWCDSMTLEYGGVDIASTTTPSTAHIVDLHTTEDKKQVLIQIAEALKYLHRNNKVHRDIKPQNILIDGQKQVRVCDFGEVIHFGPDSYDMSPAGTPEYCSPDLYTQAGWSPSSDMWSFGCVMYRALTGKDLFPELANKTQFPMTLFLEDGEGIEAVDFDNEDELLGWIDFTAQSRISENIADPQAKTLLLNLLSIDPGRRPPAGYVCAHPWFKTHQSRLADILP
ncbi:serine/threonine-protein kinase [Sansalvadorimonas verongulae]|uniref:serine/threonine-protein kinase n=1 Tax=Sansalvadorimonas verongulae TaxID=2172824 RepID=UPI0012BD1846|nr:serine/threonine-protein kinase [Sansalvadorimonas verongulae]MTI12701.1 serine/threonine-protein kinase [Sansalvadorimonas verongulae]